MIAGKTVESFEDEEKASGLKKIGRVAYSFILVGFFPCRVRGLITVCLFAFKYHTSYPLLTIKFNVF